MDRKWVRIVSDPKHNDGFFYFCSQGHDWFMTFDRLREMESSENVCPECHSANQTETDSAQSV